MPVRKTTVRRIGPLSLAKICGVLYAAIGLLVSAVMVVIVLIGLIAGAMGRRAGLPAALGALVIIILAPVAYGVLGFLGGLLSAAIYNFVAKIFGGIELDLEDAVVHPAGET